MRCAARTRRQSLANNIPSPLTPPGTPRCHHNDERCVLRDLRASAESSPRRRRVPNGHDLENRMPGIENIPPQSAQSVAQRRRRERERRERGDAAPRPRNAARSRAQQARRRNEESDRQRAMDVDGVFYTLGALNAGSKATSPQLPWI
jgi:hypothetical protein